MKNVLIIFFLVLLISFGCKKPNGIPILTTAITVTDITQTTAICGGNITSDGGSIILLRGVCWSTSDNPTIDDNKTTSNGTDIGSFTSKITGLSPNTIYYVRAYATNANGTGYGNMVSFATFAITTNEVTLITQTTATCGGNITYDGGSIITAKGVCWSTIVFNPTINDSKTSDGTGIGAFTSKLTGLLPNTTYNVRSYATNSVDTQYGNTISFITLGQPPDAMVTSATNVNTTSATLNGNVNSNFYHSVVTFEYGITTSYGNIATATQSPVLFDIDVNVDITGLTAGTLYHFRIKAVNEFGTTYSNDLTFTTHFVVNDKKK